MHLGGLAAQHLDDVDAVLGLDRVGDLPHRQRKGGLVERRQHLAVGKPPQVTAVGGGAGVHREVAGRLAERRPLAEFGDDRVGLCHGLRLLGGIGLRRNDDLLERHGRRRVAEEREIGLVEGAHLLVGGVDRLDRLVVGQLLLEARDVELAPLLAGEPLPVVVERLEAGLGEFREKIGGGRRLLAEVAHLRLDGVAHFLVGHLDAGVVARLLVHQLDGDQRVDHLVHQLVHAVGILRDRNPLLLAGLLQGVQLFVDARQRNGGVADDGGDPIGHRVGAGLRGEARRAGGGKRRQTRGARCDQQRHESAAHAPRGHGLPPPFEPVSGLPVGAGCGAVAPGAGIGAGPGAFCSAPLTLSPPVLATARSTACLSPTPLIET